ncbi:hypothetical protein K438DRAFT_1748613 [Mycena galopus ATCC 62051]|nr:hypothetical protein K438DRAFT_1748613 [Mycena galopus ATCC 62051]
MKIGVHRRKDADESERRDSSLSTDQAVRAWLANLRRCCLHGVIFLGGCVTEGFSSRLGRHDRVPVGGPAQAPMCKADFDEHCNDESQFGTCDVESDPGDCRPLNNQPLDEGGTLTNRGPEKPNPKILTNCQTIQDVSTRDNVKVGHFYWFLQISGSLQTHKLDPRTAACGNAQI